MTTSTGKVASTIITRSGLIGRDEAYTPVFLIKEPSISRRHALLSFQGNRWYIQDLGSANGSSLNGSPLEPKKAIQLPTRGTLHLGGEDGVRLAYTIKRRADPRVTPPKGPRPPKGGKRDTGEPWPSPHPGSPQSMPSTQGTPGSQGGKGRNTPGTSISQPFLPTDPGSPHPKLVVAQQPPRPESTPGRENVHQALRQALEREGKARRKLEEDLADLKRSHDKSRGEIERLKESLREANRTNRKGESLNQRLERDLAKARSALGRARAGGGGDVADQRVTIGHLMAICQEFSTALENLERTVVTQDSTGVSQRALSKVAARLGDLRMLIETLR